MQMKKTSAVENENSRWGWRRQLTKNEKAPIAEREREREREIELRERDTNGTKAINIPTEKGETKTIDDDYMRAREGGYEREKWKSEKSYLA